MRAALITQREGKDSYGAAVDSLERAYVQFAERLGYEPVAVPNGMSAPENLLDMGTESLLILTGGGSLPAEYYHEDYGYATQPMRDQTEIKLLKTALERDVPVLAICRGMQLCCGYFGGKIVRLETVGRSRPAGVDHRIRAGNRNVIVNSYHNDGVLSEDLPACFAITAMDEEKGNVEAFVMPGKRLLAIQWHPERPFSDSDGERFTKELIKNVLQIGG